MKLASTIGTATVAAALLLSGQSAHATAFPNLTVTESQYTGRTSTTLKDGDYLSFSDTSSTAAFIDLTISGGVSGVPVTGVVVPNGTSYTYYLGKVPGGPGTEGTASFSYELSSGPTVYSGTVTDVLGYAGGPGIGATPVRAVPETATWAMMLIGFGMVGSAMRARRRQTVGFAAA